MSLHPLTYTRGAAPCPTLGGRTGEALGGAADGFGSGGRDEAIFTPPPTGLKWLRTNDFGARVAGDSKARLCPATGRGRALRRMHAKGQALRVPPPPPPGGGDRRSIYG